MAFTSGPVKRTGHYQDVYKQSSTQREPLGTKWVMDTGEIYRYAYFRAAGTAGYMTVATPLITAQHWNISNATVYAIGTKNITITVSALTYAFPADSLVNGKLVIEAEVGLGHSYPIVANSAVAAAGTELQIVLGRGLIHAFTALIPEIEIIPSPWGGAGIFSNPSASFVATYGRLFPTGVPLIDVTAAYYAWVQTGGICSVLTGTSAPKAGELVFVGQTAGETGAIASYAAAAANTTVSAPVGIGLVTSVAAEYNAVYLTIDR